MLDGMVHQQMVRCGKVTCHCAGGELHGPYFYRFWRESGRLRKQYVNRAEVDCVRAECESRRTLQREMKESDRRLHALLDQIRELESQCQM